MNNLLQKSDESTPFLSLINWDDLYKKTRQNIVIDAGHVSIGNTDNCYLLGRCGCGPSKSEFLSLQIGLQIAKMLFCMGKKCTLHLCFSDTSKNFDKLKDREELKRKIASGSFSDLIPLEYRKYMDLFPDIPIEFSLQTQNSNFFTAQIKNIKKKIKTFSSVQEVFSNMGAVFLSDSSNDLFGFTHPYLFNIEKEKQIMGGDWWLEESSEIHPFDRIRAPSLLVKKMGIINVYSKSDGILCPGTYAGLLLRLDPESDRIAIYSREDDESIGEKVLRGMLTAYVFSPKFTGSNFLFVLPRNLKKLETTEITDQFRSESATLNFEAFIQAFQERNLKGKFNGYHHTLPLF